MENFPEVYRQVLEKVREKGSHTVIFDTKEQCYGERLKFYRFLAGLKAGKDEAMAGFARSIVIEWRKDTRHGHSPEKRVLVIKTQASAHGAWLGTDESAAQEIEQAAQTEDFMRAMREQALEAARKVKEAK